MSCVDALAILIILLPFSLYLLLLSSTLVEIVQEPLDSGRICFKKCVYFMMNPNHPFFHIKSSIYLLLFQLIIHWEFGK